MKVGWNSEILNSICEVEYGTRVVRKRDAGTIFPVYGGGGATFFMDTFNRENRLVIGRFAISEKCTRFVSGKFFLNDSGLTVSPKIRNLTQQYIDWYMLYKNDEIYSLGKGSAQRNLDVDEFRKLTIFFPESLPEQERIVKILDAAFEKIDRLKENAEKGLQAVKDLWQATLREELKPKEGWKKYLLKEIITDITYGTSVPSCENGEYVYLRMNNITNDGRLDLKGSKTINLSDKELEKCLVKKGDILFNRTNSLDLVGKSCVFDQETPMVIAGYIIRIRLQNDYDSQFVSYAMNYMKSLGMYRNLVVGAVHQANISAKAIQTIHLDLPDLNIQKDIVRKLDAISAKCNLLRDNYLQELDKYEALKQSILRKAFSGEL